MPLAAPVRGAGSYRAWRSGLKATPAILWASSIAWSHGNFASGFGPPSSTLSLATPILSQVFQSTPPRVGRLMVSIGSSFLHGEGM